MREFLNPFKKGSDNWGALEHLRHYKTLTVRELSIPPFNSNRPNQIIKHIKDSFEGVNQGLALTFEWKTNPNTKRRYKEFFLREVA